MKKKILKKKLLLSSFLIFLLSCVRVQDKIEPQINFSVQERYIQTLHSSFPPLTSEELKTDWGKEMEIGYALFKELDLYRAIFALKRADILLKEQNNRKLEIKYAILLSYYLGKKYEDVVETFEKSNLAKVDKSFPAFHDLLVILYDSYSNLNNFNNKNRVLEVIKKNYPETAANLELSTALSKAEMDYLYTSNNKDVQEMLQSYEKEKKSVSSAQFLNAICPGAGYMYIGQKKSAVTAFLLNSLFIFATYEFFHKGYIAPGIITAGFEAGWYFGGIYGAGEETKFYNEQVYERHASLLMTEKKLFPVLMLQYAF